MDTQFGVVPTTIPVRLLVLTLSPSTNRPASSRVNATSLLRSVSRWRPLWSRTVRCRALSKAHPVPGPQSNTNPALAFDRPPHRTLRTWLGRWLLVARNSVVGQSSPSTVADYKPFGSRLWLRPRLKPVPTTGRVDRVFDVVVNEIRPLFTLVGSCPKGTACAPFGMLLGRDAISTPSWLPCWPLSRCQSARHRDEIQLGAGMRSGLRRYRMEAIRCAIP